MDAAVDASTSQFELNEDQRAIQEMARGLRRRSRRAQCARMGPQQALSRRCDPRDRPARPRRHLCPRRCRRLGAGPARRRADLRGAVARRSGVFLLHLDPQHGGVDDRPLRQRRAAPALPAEADLDGMAGQLLPDRAGLGLGRRGAEDARGEERRRLCAERRQAVHLRRRRQRSLCRHGAHRRRRAEGHFHLRRAEGRARPLLRRQRAQDGLAHAVDPPGHFRGLQGAGGKPAFGAKAPASASPWPGSTAAG